jgi:hypothetical protein
LIGRVPAAEVEALVMTALRNHLQASGTDPQTIGNERELVEYHLEHVTLTPKHIKLQLRQDVEAPDHANDSQAPPNERLKLIAIPWTSPVSAVCHQRHHPCAGSQYTHEAVTAGRSVDCDRHGASMG